MTSTTLVTRSPVRFWIPIANSQTVFASPLPNAKLWSGPTCGLLQQQTTFINGGWWHDSSILASTGRGVEEEEKTAWEGWWNPQIV